MYYFLLKYRLNLKSKKEEAKFNIYHVALKQYERAYI